MRCYEPRYDFSDCNDCEKLAKSVSYRCRYRNTEYGVLLHDENRRFSYRCCLNCFQRKRLLVLVNFHRLFDKAYFFCIIINKTFWGRRHSRSREGSLCVSEGKNMKFSEMPYTRVDMAELEKGYKDIIDRTKAATSGEEQFAIHREYYTFAGEFQTNMTLANIRHGIDTTDSFYEAENDFYDEVTPLIQNYETEYARVLYKSPYRAELEAKLGPVFFKNIEISLKAFDEKLIPLMQEENALVSRYQKLMATAQIPFEGEIYNLSLMRKFLTDVDRDVRKRAWQAVSGFFQKVTDEIDEIYDKMVQNRTEQARMLGYENYVELGYYRMNRNCYDQEMVENFRSQVKASFVPFVSKIHEQRRKRLGIGQLTHYDNDVYIKEGNPCPIGTPEEILAAGQKMYHELSAETAEFFDFMMENELFDVLGRKTKQQGGYMTYLPKYRSPFIFANFNGTSGDVDVITHECGHAFQGYLTRNEEIREFADITMETAEIHSMSMEYFTYQWMDLFFGDRKDDYLMMHLEDSAAFIPYGCMVDEFQHRVYADPELTPAQRKDIWRELEHTYRPHIDYEGDMLEEAIWQNKLHIFVYPFYYIDYVLASICAMQFKVRMDADFSEAWENYVKLCKLSARDFYVNVIRQVGLDSPFENGSIEKLVEKMEQKIC